MKIDFDTTAYPLEHMIRCETQIGQGYTFLLNDPISINHLLTNV